MEQPDSQLAIGRFVQFRWACRSIVLLLGTVQAAAARNTMNVDGISYLDIATEYLRGHVGNAINGYWSPLYSWLIAAVLGLVDPSPRWEFAAVHALNLVLFAAALAAFDFFLRELFRTDQPVADLAATPPGNAWWLLGYACFSYSSLVLINLRYVGPDIFLSAIIYTMAGLLLRLSRNSGVPLRLASMLGLILGFGYLTKAVMLPVGIVTLAVLVALMRQRPGKLICPAVAAVAFICVSGPWIVTLSKAKGRFTTGDAGKLNFAWHVDGVRLFRHWQGDSLSGSPVHGTRSLSADPAIYEFAAPVAGTYPVWFDPSYWYEGVKRRGDMRSQMRRISQSAQDLLDQQWFYPAAVAILAAWLSTGVRRSRRALAATWFVLVPMLAGFGLYSLVHILGRYMAPFVAVTVPTLLFAAAYHREGEAVHHDAPANALAASLAVVLMLMVTYQLGFSDRYDRPRGHPQLELTHAMQQMGVRRGMRLGVIGESSNAYWARLAGAQIVAEITPEENARFWSGPPARRAALLELFRRAGTVAVVADHVPSWADTASWTPLGNSGYWISGDLTMRAR